MTGLWLAVLVAVAEPPSGALDDDAFRFCHEAGYDAVAADAWCELLEGAPPERCPGLRETCAGAAPKPSTSSGCDEGSNGGSASKRGAAGAPDRPSKPWQPEACQLPEARLDAFAALLKWVGAIVVALAVLVVLRLVWTYLGGRRDPPVEPPPVDVAVVTEPPPDEVVPEVPGDDLLASARRALAAGDFAAAVLFARAAALRGLADRGLLKLHRARTDREYARAVRGRDEVHGALREILGAVEVHRWGGAPLDQPRSQGAVEAADRLLRALGVALLVAILAADDARAQIADRYGPDGDAALRDLLVAWGHDAGFRLRGFATLDETTDALVLDTTFVTPDAEGWASVRAWVEAGGVLVVAGPTELPELGTLVFFDTPLQVVGTPILGDLLLPVPRLPGGLTRGFDGGQGEAWVVGEGAHGEATVAVQVVPLGQGVVVGIAEARLLWNGALVHPDNERFLGDLLYAGQGALGWPLPPRARVELATTATAESPTPSSSILNADLLPFVGQLLVTWALLGLSLGIPFAILKDPAEQGRIAFADHVRALGLRWWRLRASRHALAAMGGLWLHRLGPTGLRHAAIRAGRDPWRADELVAAVKRAVDDPAGPDDPRDLEWMEELWTITRSR